MRPARDAVGIVEILPVSEILEVVLKFLKFNYWNFVASDLHRFRDENDTLYEIKATISLYLKRVE